MQTILAFILSVSPAFAADQASPTLTKHELDALEQLTATLERQTLEDDARADFATTILERTIASERPESATP